MTTMDDNLHREFWKGIRSMFEALKTSKTKTNPFELTPLRSDSRFTKLSPVYSPNYLNNFSKEKSRNDHE